MRRRAVLAAPAAMAMPAFAQQARYPEPGRRVELIVPYPPGGGNDTGARALAPLLERELGIPFVVLNRPGAASQIGMTQVARARPDGYTIGYGLWPQTTTLYLEPARQAQFTRESFSTICLHATDPGVILVRADSPLRTLADLVAASRARPDDFRMSDNGQLGHEHLASLRLQELAGLRFNQIHFQGAGPAITALLGGQTEAGVLAVGTSMAMVRQGAMRGLAVMAVADSPYMPGVPTARAQGFDVVFGSIRAFVAPAGLPPDVHRTLAEAFRRAIASPEHVEKMRELGIGITYQAPAEFAQSWAAEEAALRPVIARLSQEGRSN